MPAEHASNPHGSKRLKTDLACDTCRRRKQRCDGKRPSCAQCELAGFSCSYRPTPTSFETDASVLARLAQTEARLEVLERERLSPPETGTGPGVRNSLLLSTDDSRTPDLHTAAGHKILQYWPRLRVKLTLDLELFTFLKAADHEDTFLTGLVLGAEQEFPLVPTIQALEDLYENQFELPLSLVDLLKVSPYFSKEHVLKSFYEARQVHQTILNLRECSLESLLVQTIAVRITRTDSPRLAHSTAEIYFKLALESFWKLHSESDEYAIPLTLCFAHILLYFFARPFNALGILQALKSAIDRFDKRRSGDELLEGQKEVYNRLHYLLESDILTELDGVPSATSLRPSSISRPTPSEVSSTNNSTHEYLIQSQLFLRIILNKVLGSLYTANEAYITPEEAGPVISSLSIKLDTWYQSLPLEMQFSRNISSFNFTSRSMPLRIIELALRYYACHFILHRVVLYMVVYEDMEEAATPRSTRKEFEPWVLETCRSCTENAGLIILTQHAQYKSADNVPYHSWCDLQLLVGAYAVLLQVQSVPALAPMFRDLGEIDSLLDAAEMVLRSVPFTSLSTWRTLDALTNVRYNLTLQTPR